EVAVQMGVDPVEAKVLMQDDPAFAGAFSDATNTIYVNDLAQNSSGDAVKTVGHETQHYLDSQQNGGVEESAQYAENREEYAGVMGAATEDYLSFNFAQNDATLATDNLKSLGTDSETISSNLTSLSTNQLQYDAEDPTNLDNNILRTIPAIVEGGELAVLGAVALAGDEDAQQQFARDVETLFNNVNTALG
ncbi:hypothetical protein, partial [Alteromonas ponticola]